MLQSFSYGIPTVNNYENSLLVGQDESSLASTEAGLSPAVIAVILIKYLDEEYLFLCNIYNAVTQTTPLSLGYKYTLLTTQFKNE